MSHLARNIAIEFVNEVENRIITEKERETGEITAIITFQGNAILKGKFNFKFVTVLEVFEDQRGISPFILSSKKIRALHTDSQIISRNYAMQYDLSL
jgi:hypothetical protein